MKSLVLEKPGKFIWVNKLQPAAPCAGEVLLKTKKVSICGTDLHAYKGNQPFFQYPRILGHEIAAEVIAVGSQVNGIKTGDLCSVEPYYNLLNDQAVKRGKTNCGSQISVLGVHQDGALQEAFICGASNIHITNSMNADQVAMIEPFAIGCHAVERADLQFDDTILVVGAGPIGLAIIASARLHGLPIVVMDINQNRLDFAKHKFPDIDTLLLSETVEQSLEKLFGHLPTVVFDATGNKASMQQGFQYAAAGGTIVFVGLFPGDVTFSETDFHRKEITLKASRNARSRDFKKVITLMRAGLIDTSGYITHRLPFDDVIGQFDKLYLPEENVIKAIVDF